MFRRILAWLLVASLTVAVAALDFDDEDSDLFDGEGRLLVLTLKNATIPVPGLNITAGGGNLGQLLAALLPYIVAGAVSAAVSLGISLPVAYLACKKGYGYGYDYSSDSGYGSSSGSGYGDSGGYSSYSSYRRSFDPYAIDWEKFSIIDWIAIGEEAWRKFDPADLECQKRLICEIHQNTSRFGAPAARLVDLFSYLQYVEVLSLPDEIKALIEEYNDAADRGRSIQKDCGDVYTTCDFSVKQIMEKYSHNEI